MFNCLIQVCFIAGITLTGDVGIQTGQRWDSKAGAWAPMNELDVTNAYGAFLGRAELRIDFVNDMHLSLVHISGINTEEPDMGMNMLMLGWEGRLFR